jgi:AcrR family transcriptional regulator
MPRPPVEGRRERKKREMRARIYQAARKLFAEQGLEGTTVEQVAAEADVAQATFFNYFPSKQAVLREMTAEVFEFLHALLERQLRAPASTRERLERFAAAAADGIGQARNLAREVLLELMRSSARPGGPPPYLEQIHEPFVAVIREGQHRGEVRSDCDARYLAEMVVGMFNTAITNWISDPDYPVEERLRRTAVFVGDAIERSSATPTPESLGS